MEDMANVLESKTVVMHEVEQLEQNSSQEMAAEKQAGLRLKAEETRRIQTLCMARARVREQLARSSNDRYTILLTTELQQIESELEKLA